MMIDIDILATIKGRVICSIDGVETDYESGEAVLEHLKSGRIDLKSIAVRDGIIVVELTRPAPPTVDFDDPWVQEHIEEFRKEPNPFDGV